MISEKERFNSLKEKIVQLEAELEEKNSIVNQYQSVEKAADSKQILFFDIFLFWTILCNLYVFFHIFLKFYCTPHKFSIFIP